MNFNKYTPFPYAPVMEDRHWPSNKTKSAPRFVSVDLRDGNQALERPMDAITKLRYFKHLVKMGFKEIEVAYPSASQSDFDFVRCLIEDNHIPSDVTIQVLLPCIEELIDRTFEAVKGASKVIMHLYNSTSKEQREQVFKMTENQIKALALMGTAKIKDKARDFPGKIIFEYSPESFSGTENEFALEICSEVISLWNPGEAAADKMIINLPNTVESCPSNIYADRIEWMSNRLPLRDRIILSVHVHNDRGSAVASTEMALLAGAVRVEGTLMGNGERSGNVDIITLALNLLTQGIDPELDISEIGEIRSLVEETTDINVHHRHPYSGRYIHTAFSGTHQDAIKKGLYYNKEKSSEIWNVPYLPIDPADLGLTYENIIRINSQSGKGGISYILEKFCGYIVPKEMQPCIRQVFKKITSRDGDTLNNKEIKDIFELHFVNREDKLKLIGYNEGKELTKETTDVTLSLVYLNETIDRSLSSSGFLESVISIVSSLGDVDISITDFSEHTMGKNSDSFAVSYIKLFNKKSGLSSWGAGLDVNSSAASLKAVISAFNIMNT